MVKFICHKCNYRFYPRAGRADPPRRCPWCDREGTVMIEASAEELVRSVDVLLEKS